MTPYVITALALAALLAAGAVHCIRRAARLVDAIQRERADADFTAHCDDLLAIIRDTQPGRDEAARLLLEDMYRQPAVARRNTGRRPT